MSCSCSAFAVVPKHEPRSSAAGCAALDYGYATWFSHQVDEVIARDKEDDLAGGVEILQRNSSWLPRYAILLVGGAYSVRLDQEFTGLPAR